MCETTKMTYTREFVEKACLQAIYCEKNKAYFKFENAISKEMNKKSIFNLFRKMDRETVAERVKDDFSYIMYIYKDEKIISRAMEILNALKNHTKSEVELSLEDANMLCRYYGKQCKEYTGNLKSHDLFGYLKDTECN